VQVVKPPFDQRQPLRPGPVLDLLLAGERLTDVLELGRPDEAHGQTPAGVLGPQAEQVLSKPVFQIASAADVQSPIGAFEM